MTAPLPTAKPVADPSAMLDALRALFEPGDVIELRALHKGKKRTDAGYFDADHWPQLVTHAERLNNQGAAVYVTLNPVNPQLLGRYNNRMQDHANATATDNDIVTRRWLLVDIDPKRPKDTSATPAQFEAAQSTARHVYQHLAGCGWPAPIVGESGNGMHLLYPLALPNDTASRDLCKSALQGLAARFDTDMVSIDVAVFNAGRITKLYGTVANKGDHTDAAPWRLSRLVSVPVRGDAVTVEQLREVAQLQSHDDQGDDGNVGGFDLPAFLGRLGIGYDQDTHEGSDRYKLHHCPFNPEHGYGESAVFRRPSGALAFKCMHSTCAGNDWHKLRELVDGPRESRTGAQADISWLMQGLHQHDGAANEHTVRNVSLICGADLKPEAINWLWPGWLAAGKMHVFGGAPGTGKTTIAMALAATVTIGGRWPDGSRCAAGNVVIWSGEDDPADTLIPRLALSGADLSKVFFISDVTEGRETRSFDPARDMETLRRKLADIGGARLLIVDPIVSAVTGDSHKNAEVRRGLQPLVDLAAAMRCALLGITHFSKGTGGRDPVERLTGSLAFGALARVVLVAAKQQEEGDDGRTVRIFCRAKSNIGPDDGGFEYDLHQAELKEYPGVFASSALWGNALEGAARDLLATADAAGDDGEGGTLADAKRFLIGLLEDGPLRVKAIKADANDAGYSWATIRRAQKALEIEAVKGGMKDGWLWRLPPIEPTKVLKKHEGAQQNNVSTFGEFEHLRQDQGEVEIEI